MVQTIYLLVLGITVIAVTALIAYAKKDEQREINSQQFIAIGVVFLGAGVTLSTSTGNPGLIGISGVGVAFLAIGLKNRDKWNN